MVKPGSGSRKHRRSRGNRADQRGIVLYMVLVVVLLLMAAGAVLGIHLQRRTAIFHDQQRNFHVQALLDSGTAVALSDMKQDFQYQGSRTVSIDGGSVVTSVRFTSKTGIRELRVTSKYRGESRRVSATVRVEKDRSPEVLSWNPVASWE